MRLKELQDASELAPERWISKRLAVVLHTCDRSYGNSVDQNRDYSSATGRYLEVLCQAK